MKKTVAIFGALFAFFTAFTLANLDKINSSIFDLLAFEGEKKEILQALNASMASQIIIAGKDKIKFENFVAECEKSGVFENIFYQIGSLAKYQNELNKYKIALLDSESVRLLETNASAFFARAAGDFFNKFKPLATSQDFFSLSAHSRLSSGAGEIKFDPREDRFFADFNGARYYFARAKLAGKYDINALLALVERAKKDELLISGGAIYAATGKKAAARESVFMGIISLALCVGLLLLAFKNARIFYVATVVIFGLSSGLFALFAAFDDVYGMAIVVSTSLVGLMLDFAAHWLSRAKGVARAGSVRSVRGVFLLGFFITAGGYAVFLFSPFALLAQIAVFAVFALAGAFGASYFLLPALLDGARLSSVGIFERFLDFLIRAVSNLKFLNAKIIFLLSLALGAFLWEFAEFGDDVREYSSSEPDLLNMSAKIAQISGESFDILVTPKDSNLSQNLKDSGLVSAVIAPASLSEEGQTRVKKIFASLDASLMPGFPPAVVSAELAKIAATPVYSPSEVAKSPIFGGFEPTLIEGKDVFLLRGVRDAGTVEKIAKKENGVFVNMRLALSEGFESVKINAVYLKIAAYALAFALLAAFFGAKEGARIVLAVFFAGLVTLALLSVFGASVNIFVIFALILGGAVGIDYMIFALSPALAPRQKVFGIALAAFTSMISFFALAFSSTRAVSVFGLAVGINIFVCMILAQVFALTNAPEN